MNPEAKLEFRDLGESPDCARPVLSGYFIRFDDEYNFAPGKRERIAPDAFVDSLRNNPDVLFLAGHDSNMVLGRNGHTGQLRIDDVGLYGEIEINPNDSDAMNLYHRVCRGDIQGCSFGFRPQEVETASRGNDKVYTVRKGLLHEVSVCSFPAYTRTNICARSAEYDHRIDDILRRLKDVNS